MIIQWWHCKQCGKQDELKYMGGTTKQQVCEDLEAAHQRLSPECLDYEDSVIFIDAPEPNTDVDDWLDRVNAKMVGITKRNIGYEE